MHSCQTLSSASKTEWNIMKNSFRGSYGWRNRKKLNEYCVPPEKLLHSNCSPNSCGTGGIASLSVF